MAVACGVRCSVASGQVAESMAGTTAVAEAWLCVEQPGPWGRDALIDSHLDSAVARELAMRSKVSGVRVAVIRRPGRHADRHGVEPRRVFVAHTRPGTSWLEQAVVTDPAELLDIDLVAVAEGVRPGFDPVAAPLLMVCTNGRRDVCCALYGRPVAAELDVWECGHTGGHRFAPTGVLLPSGYCYGRMDVELGARLLASRDVVIERCRGRSTWDPAGQVAELAVREVTGERDPDALVVGVQQGQWVPVSHVDGRHWTVTVETVTGQLVRPPLCGAEPVPPVSVVATSVVAT
jgi:hypothetical protein